MPANEQTTHKLSSGKNDSGYSFRNILATNKENKTRILALKNDRDPDEMCPVRQIYSTLKTTSDKLK